MIQTTGDPAVHPSLGTELQCLVDDVAAGGADDVVGGPGDPAPHVGGQAGDGQTGELVGLDPLPGQGHRRAQHGHGEVVHGVGWEQFHLQDRVDDRRDGDGVSYLETAVDADCEGADLTASSSVD